MRRARLSRSAAERLLRGERPRDFAPVADVLAAARGPGSDAELGGEERALADFRAVRPTRPAPEVAPVGPVGLRPLPVNAGVRPAGLRVLSVNAVVAAALVAVGCGDDNDTEPEARATEPTTEAEASAERAEPVKLRVAASSLDVVPFMVPPAFMMY